MPLIIVTWSFCDFPQRMDDPLLEYAERGQRGSDADSHEEQPTSNSLSGKALVLVLFCILTGIATFEKVALKKATDSLLVYQVFLNQLIVLLFIIVFLGVVVYKARVRSRRFLCASMPCVSMVYVTNPSCE